MFHYCKSYIMGLQ